MRTLIFKSVDGVDLPADVHDAQRPNGVTILWIHGGGLIAGTRKEPPLDVIQWLTARGYKAVLPDYRLAPETKVAGILDDIRDAYRWTKTLDGNRVVLVGQSAGGYLALTLAGELRPAALVSLYGYGRINSDWSNALPGSTRRLPRAGRWKEWLLSSRIPARMQPRARIYYSGVVRYTGQWTECVVGELPADFRALNPEERVTPSHPPTLFIHGELDTDVPSSESLRMANALAAQRVPHELVVVPRRAHGFDLQGLRDSVVTDCLERMHAFITARLSGP